MNTVIPVTFSPSTNFVVGENPVSIAVGNFNNDDQVDLAVVNFNSWNISVLLGYGDGRFANQAVYAVGANPTYINTGDFNTDGNTDLVVTNSADNTISILLGSENGNGEFSEATTFAVGNYPNAISVNDFNSDGKPDLAVANLNDSTVSILLNDGRGDFSNVTSFNVRSNPKSIDVGDFNNDGKIDLVTQSKSNATISVLLGDGSGNFSLKDSDVDYLPYTISVGDFNNDTKSDFVTTNFQANKVSVLLGNGQGGITTQTSFFVGTNPQIVKAVDFNLDGNQDLVTSNYSSNNVSVLLGNGIGEFLTQTNFATDASPQFVNFGYFNNDGKPDLVTVSGINNTVSVLLNTTESTSTSDPTTSDPTTSDPTISDPTTSDPTTSDPTTSDPTTSDPTTSDPTTSDSTTSDPTTSDPTTSDPTTSDPTTSTLKLFIGNTASAIHEMNLNGYDASRPLHGVHYTSVAFKIDGELFKLRPDLESVETYDDLYSAIELAIFWQSFAYPELLDMTVTRIPNGENFISKDGQLRTGDTFILSFPGHELEIGAGGWTTERALPSDNSFYSQISQVPSTISPPIEEPNHEPTGTVTISGIAEVGQTLTAHNTLADVDGMGSLTYEWYSNKDNDEEYFLIPNVTQSTYRLTASDIGKSFLVDVSYTDLKGHYEELLSEGTKLVTAPTQNAPTPIVSTLSGSIKTLLSNRIFTISDNDVNAIGGTGGNEIVRIQSGVSKTILNANIERLELSNSLSNYKFIAVLGEGLEIWDASSKIATIPSLNQDTKIAFSNGTTILKQTGASDFQLGNSAISNSVATTPAGVFLNASDLPGIQNAATSTGFIKTLLSNSTFTVSDNGVNVIGGAKGNEVVRIQSGITDTMLNANIERLELSSALFNYKFIAVSGVGIEILDSSNSKIATIPSLNQDTKIAFSNGTAILKQTGASNFQLGNSVISNIAATTLSNATLDTSDLSSISGFLGGSTTINAANLIGTGTAGVDTFNIAAGTYNATINGFAAGDKLNVFSGASVTVTSDTNQTDGIQAFTVDDLVTGIKASITLTGLTTEQDAGVFNVSSFNTVFGEGTI
jgi:hypothetical protein